MHHRVIEWGLYERFLSLSSPSNIKAIDKEEEESAAYQ